MTQSLAKVYIHTVFSTKNREALLIDGWREELFSILGATANNLGCQSLIAGGVADHVHMLFQLGRTITIADSVGKIKSTSSLWINQHHAAEHPFHWQGGYAAFSIGQASVETIREYIRTQADHHRKESFQDELRRWMRNYGIDWDECYVWG